LIALCAPLFIVLAMASPAYAQNEHFVRASATLNANGTLTANFKEAGLGTNQLIDYALTADATATYVCVNRGGANPSAQNKTTVAGPVIATGTFNSGKNGQVTASPTVSPPPSTTVCAPVPGASPSQSDQLRYGHGGKPPVGERGQQLVGRLHHAAPFGGAFVQHDD
jgi:hypothetical protein